MGADSSIWAIEMAKIIPSTTPPPVPTDGVSLAIGMMDGLHLGHQKVLRDCLDFALEHETSPMLMTFNPHPRQVISPQEPFQRLFTVEDNCVLMAELGRIGTWVHPFDAQFAKMPAQAFVPYLKEKLPGLVSLHVGEDFRYGAQHAGDAASLVASGALYNSEVRVQSSVIWQEEKISSSRVRAALVEANLAAVEIMLGRLYRTWGTVTPGDQRGRTIGFPTLNFPWKEVVRPKYGVYAVRVARFGSGRWQGGAANFGVRPTVSEDPHPLLEVHVLEPTTLNYGDVVEVQWLKFIRPEVKFPSLDALMLGIKKDCQKVWEVLL